MYPSSVELMTSHISMYNAQSSDAWETSVAFSIHTQTCKI